MKINKHIEIVSSTVSGLSSMSKVSRAGIVTALAKYYTHVSITIVNDIADLEALVEAKPDLVFLGMKFIPVNPSLGSRDPHKIWLSEYFDQHGIAYTGSGHVAHELELDKALAKQRVLDAGLETSPYLVIKQNHVPAVDSINLCFPLFVKPTDRGGGLGIDDQSVVYDFNHLVAKVNSITTKFGSDSLVEEYLPGREFSVAILKNEFLADFSIMPIELIAPLNEHGERFLSSEVKSADTEKHRQVTDRTIKTRINKLAIDVFHALGARDYGRIDIRLDKAGTPHFLEANLLPSLIETYGNFPKACLLTRKLDFEPMLLIIVRLALGHSLNIFKDIPRILPSIAPIESILKA